MDGVDFTKIKNSFYRYLKKINKASHILRENFYDYISDKILVSTTLIT